MKIAQECFPLFASLTTTYSNWFKKFILSLSFSSLFSMWLSLLSLSLLLLLYLLSCLCYHCLAKEIWINLKFFSCWIGWQKVFFPLLPGLRWLAWFVFVLSCYWEADRKMNLWQCFKGGQAFSKLKVSRYVNQISITTKTCSLISTTFVLQNQVRRIAGRLKGRLILYICLSLLSAQNAHTGRFQVMLKMGKETK